MKTLSALGVVTVERGRGTFVNPSDRWSRVHPAVLATLVRTPEDLAATSRSLIEARRLVEVGVAELAAERRNEAHLVALNEQLEAMWGAHESADADAWASADLAFHDTLMEAADNPFVTMLFSPLEQMLRRDRHEPAIDSANRRRALRWHQRILDAVVAADPRSAREAMDGHLRDTQDILAQWRADDDPSSDGSAAEQGVHQ
jgi:DNA-binding FadR family transcriptional regulator